MDPLGDVLLAVHEDLGDDFFCMICTNMTYMCHILSHLALKNYFLAVLEKSLSWVMVVTLILESLLWGPKDILGVWARSKVKKVVKS